MILDTNAILADLNYRKYLIENITILRKEQRKRENYKKDNLLMMEKIAQLQQMKDIVHLTMDDNETNYDVENFLSVYYYFIKQLA